MLSVECFCFAADIVIFSQGGLQFLTSVGRLFPARLKFSVRGEHFFQEMYYQSLV